MIKNKKNVFLFLSHLINDEILYRFNSLKEQLNNLGDVKLLIQDESHLIQEGNDIIPFSTSSLNDLNYIPISQTLTPGSTHFPILHFYKFHEYEYYWVIEYDVLFNGSWNTIILDFLKIESDLLASHIRSFDEDIDWYWWNSLKFVTKKIQKENYVRSFNPIYRLSFKALQIIDKSLKEENYGHYEGYIATILSFYKCKLIDFGGIGRYVMDGYQNKYYIFSPDNIMDNTMRYRPSITKNEIVHLNKLYHPVK